ncbi:MAG: nucleotidyltransferase family protein [Chitinophagales bacterium]|nr:nucleotidyltransferase family protein [Chitinophagales bacterium]
MKAMIFAAGLGTRLKPLTEHIPKALVKVNDKPLLERSINYLAKYGFNEIIINIHHFPNEVKFFLSSFNDKNINISISDETDMLLETGGGLKKAAPFFLENKAPFALVNVDILTDLDLSKMLAFHDEKNSIATLAVMKRNSSRQLLFDQNKTLKGWQNVQTNETKPPNLDCHNLESFAFSGIHIVSTKIFELFDERQKFSITDTYINLCKSWKIKGFDHTGDKFIDVGKPGSVEQASLMFE